MTIAIGTRPGQLDGCWRTWEEDDIDVVTRTEMEAGNLKTRRRFTGTARMVIASVTLKASLYTPFMTWWRVNQQQGAKATPVKTPYGTTENFQWVTPPHITWPNERVFTATVQMYRGADFP